MDKKSDLAANLKKSFILIVSLPQNSYKLASAAQAGGADALKVHINVEHKASKTKFGSWQEEKKRIKEVLNEVNISVGIMPGEKIVAGKEEIEEMEEVGIEFFDIYIKNLPLYLLKSKMKKMLALDSNYNAEDFETLKEFKFDFLESSIVPSNEYGKDLTLNYLIKYKRLKHIFSQPIIVPTQLKIKPEEVKYLKDIGMGGIMIGAVVTGKEADSIKKTTYEFRKQIDYLIRNG